MPKNLEIENPTMIKFENLKAIQHHYSNSLPEQTSEMNLQPKKKKKEIEIAWQQLGKMRETPTQYSSKIKTQFLSR
jgi:hypothetical protein